MVTSLTRSSFSLPLTALLLLSTASHALAAPQTTAESRETDIEVVGKPEGQSKVVLSQDAASSPAAVDVLSAADIAKLPISSYGDLLRALPGVVVNNYGQGAVPYGISLRGFDDGDHGKSVATFVDGMPINEGSIAQAHGWVDLNTVPPELIERLELIKGPFSVRAGDFAQSGVLNIVTAELPENRVSAAVGTYGFVRGLVIAGFKSGQTNSFIALEGVRSDGFRDNSGEKRGNVYVKTSFPLFNGRASVRLNAYGVDSEAPGYLRLPDVLSGRVSDKAAVDSSDGFDRDLYSGVFNYNQAVGSGSFALNFYVSDALFKRFSNFGSQGESRSEQSKVGIEANRVFTLGKVQLLFGASLRNEATQSAQFSTFRRTRLSTNANKDIDIFSLGLYSEVQVQVLTNLKITGGGRYDYFDYQLKGLPGDRDLRAGQELSASPDAFSPKGGIALSLGEFEFFANAARGFRSPSGFDELPFNPTLSFSRLSSYEIGLQRRPSDGKGLAFGITGFTTDQTNEVGDPTGRGIPVNFGLTRRNGIEADARFQQESFAVFANFTYNDADIISGSSPSARFVPRVPRFIATLGGEAALPGGIDGQFTVQRIGSKKLNTSGSFASEDYTRITGRLNLKRERFDIFAATIIYPGDSRFQETQFDFGEGFVMVDPKAQFYGQIGLNIRF
jgi:outer membrane receptor protein involved in Fe transport